MTLTIVKEDGTGVTNANAYETAAETATRLTDLGLAGFAALSAPNQAAALYRGTADVEARIAPHLTGRRSVSTQGLSYPRTLSYHQGVVIESTTIPMALVLACAYAAGTEAQRIADGDADRGEPGVRASSAPGSSVEYWADGGRSAALLDDRAAPYVRQMIAGRRAA